tara:strand:- start:8392 stop:8544 length:153 start_codon:yes stop_codon:yes gene_type:complete
MFNGQPNSLEIAKSNLQFKEEMHSLFTPAELEIIEREFEHIKKVVEEYDA